LQHLTLKSKDFEAFPRWQARQREMEREIKAERDRERESRFMHG